MGRVATPTLKVSQSQVWSHFTLTRMYFWKKKHPWFTAINSQAKQTHAQESAQNSRSTLRSDAKECSISRASVYRWAIAEVLPLACPTPFSPPPPVSGGRTGDATYPPPNLHHSRTTFSPLAPFVTHVSVRPLFLFLSCHQSKVAPPRWCFRIEWSHKARGD